MSPAHRRTRDAGKASPVLIGILAGVVTVLVVAVAVLATLLITSNQDSSAAPAEPAATSATPAPTASATAGVASPVSTPGPVSPGGHSTTKYAFIAYGSGYEGQDYIEYELSDDGTTLTMDIDMRPEDNPEYYGWEDWGLEGDRTPGCLMKGLSTPSSVIERMNATRYVDGQQYATWDDVECTWYLDEADHMQVVAWVTEDA